MSTHRLQDSETSRERRNISLDAELDEWLSEQDNASRLIEHLLLAYRAYGDAEQAIDYVSELERQS